MRFNFEGCERERVCRGWSVWLVFVMTTDFLVPDDRWWINKDTGINVAAVFETFVSVVHYFVLKSRMFKILIFIFVQLFRSTELYKIRVANEHFKSPGHQKQKMYILKTKHF